MNARDITPLRPNGTAPTVHTLIQAQPGRYTVALIDDENNWGSSHPVIAWRIYDDEAVPAQPVAVPGIFDTDTGVVIDGDTNLAWDLAGDLLPQSVLQAQEHVAG